MVKSWSHGFLTISNIIYDFKNNAKEDYLSDWRRFKYAANLNGNKSVVLDNKLLFHIMNKDNEHVPPVTALIKNRRIYNQSAEIPEEMSLEEFYLLVKKHKFGFIIKPFMGGGGGGISKVVYCNDQICFTGFCKSPEGFLKMVRSGISYLMTEIIVQTGKSKVVFPKTINSLRILTMIDPVSQKPFIASAVHRFGVSKSGVVDNWSAGGLSVHVDAETGIMGKGSIYPQTGNMVWLSSHPETDVKFEGLKVQNWEEIKNSVFEMALLYFYLPYVGWDVVPSEDGFYFLEGNNNSDVNLLQIHGGLLKNEKAKSFYRYHNII